VRYLPEILLLLGIAAAVAGVWVVFGLGWALIALGLALAAVAVVIDLVRR